MYFDIIIVYPRGLRDFILKSKDYVVTETLNIWFYCDLCVAGELNISNVTKNNTKLQINKTL